MGKMTATMITDLPLTLIVFIVCLIDAAFANPYSGSSVCVANNCARAVTGTRRGSSFQAQATSDCVFKTLVAVLRAFLMNSKSSFLLQTVTEPSYTVTVTSTYQVNATVGLRKRQTLSAIQTGLQIPWYASACADAFQYASACSCLGVKAGTLTLGAATTTTTYTFTSITTFSSPVPGSSSYANTTTTTASSASLTSSIYANTTTTISTASPTSSLNATSTTTIPSSTPTPQCPSNQTCSDGFQTCGAGSSCFCFSGYTGIGFCGDNVFCDAVTACATDSDCDAGSVCATNTCCDAPSEEQPGICLTAQCSNPGAKLIKMARMLERTVSGGDTAAYRGH